MTSIHQGQSDCGHHGESNLPTTDTNTESLIWHHSPAWSASDLLTRWLHWPISVMTRKHFILTTKDRYSGHGFIFSEHIISAKTTIRTHRMLHPPSELLTQHCFWLRNSLHSRWRVESGLCSWNSLFLPYFPLSWSSWLDGMVEWYSKVTVTVLVRWQSISGLCTHWVSTISLQIQGPQVQKPRSENGSCITHHYPLWPTKAIWFSFLLPDALLASRSWFQKGEFFHHQEWHDSIGLEIKAAGQSLELLRVSESSG